jgi:hypothetical protein
MKYKIVFSSPGINITFHFDAESEVGALHGALLKLRREGFIDDDYDAIKISKSDF